VSHIFLQPDFRKDASWPLTIESVSAAVRSQWPGTRLYVEGDGEDRRVGFFVQSNGTNVDCTFWERKRFLAVDLGDAGAAFCEWFLRLLPEDLPCIVYTEQETSPVSIPARATAQEVLRAARR
jgi:hypothetical protein